MTFDYVTTEEVDLRGALLVSGLPAVGMEGTVAATFLSQQLDMRIVGAFQSMELPPVGAVRNGLATSPIQVWAAELACGPDGSCDRLLVLKSDLPIPPALQMDLAASVMEWAREQKIALIIGLDTYTVNGKASAANAAAKSGADHEVLVATSVAARDMQSRVGGRPMEEALVTGFTAALLMRANREGIATVGLFAPSTVPEAEVEGTTALIETARPLIPKLNIQTSDLVKVVEKHSHALRQEREKQAEETRRMRELANRGYH